MHHHIRVRAGALIIENQSMLLIEFKDENGLHYNLPGGGVNPGETVIDAVQREVMEEASIAVEVGPLAFVYEYVPHLNDYKFGKTHALHLMFECTIKEGCRPKMPEHPDLNQTDVKWVKRSELKNIILYPDIREHMMNYVENKRNIDIKEQHLLEEKNISG